MTGAKFIDDVVSPTSERNATILKCFLKGFSRNVARLQPDRSYRTVVGNHLIAIHPSSCLFDNQKVEAIMYNEHTFTNQSYGKNASAIQMNWIRETFELLP